VLPDEFMNLNSYAERKGKKGEGRKKKTLSLISDYPSWY
jgi:hypothetical protein